MNDRNKSIGVMTVCAQLAAFLVVGADGVVAAKMEDAWRQLETNLLYPKTEILADYRLPRDLGLGPYDKGINWNTAEVQWNEK